MKTPQDFIGWNGILNTGMVLLACAYISVGFYGYLKYGEGVHDSITLDLPMTTYCWISFLSTTVIIVEIFGHPMLSCLQIIPNGKAGVQPGVIPKHRSAIPHRARYHIHAHQAEDELRSSRR